MPRLYINDNDEAVEYSPGPSLLEILSASGLIPPSPCGGSGTCGKCLVKAAGAGLSPITEHERRFLNSGQLAGGMRLACQVWPEADLSVRIALDDSHNPVLASGYLPRFTLAPWIGKELFQLAPEDRNGNGRQEQAPLPAEDLLLGALGAKSLAFNVLRRCDTDFFPAGGGLFTAVYNDGEPLAVEPGDSTQSLFGLAVDVGTTTVVAALMDLRDGRELGAQTAINPQKQYGFDVLTRISNIIEQGAESLARQQQSIVGCLNALARRLCADNGIRPDEIYAVAVAANTAMLHILCGVNPASLGRAPYRPVFTRSREFPAADIGLNLHPQARLYCLPSASAYVGADIVAGIYVSGLHQREDTVLFIDIGTNGEMALARNGRLLACSCAAGPALEGMNITHGMRAAAGAIEKISITRGEVTPYTIGNTVPIGICGSGLLSAVTEFLAAGAILRRGNILKPADLAAGDPRKSYCRIVGGKPVLLLDARSESIFLTQGDIRQVQLAKGALLAGVLALLAQAGLEPDDIDRVFIAGQFGAHLPAEILTGCGILPPMLDDRVEYLGNTSKSGASLALLSDNCRKDMEKIRDAVSFIELSTLPGFEKLFVSCLDFPTGQRTCG